MFVVGLTGGIGSGKSTFAALLAERGAQVIDADLLGRDALKPGAPAWHSVVDQFGDEILAPHSMEIDRGRLADIVFNSKESLAALNAIVHPVIFKGVADQLELLQHTSAVVVLDAALIFETGMDKNCDVLVAVVTDARLREDRVTSSRKSSLANVRARMASQMTSGELIEKADIVVENNRDMAALVREADRVWEHLESMQHS